MILPPRKLDHRALEFSAEIFPGWKGAKNDEGIAVFGHPEGVHFEAERRRRACGGDLPTGRDQSGDLLQLEEEVRRRAADGDEAAEAARGRKYAAGGMSRTSWSIAINSRAQ